MSTYVCDYDSIVDVKDPLVVDEDWLELNITGLDQDAFYVAPLYLWAQEERPMRVEIYHPEHKDPVFAGKFRLGPNPDANGNFQWTTKRYKLNSERHNGNSIIKLGFSYSSPGTPQNMHGFQVWAKPLTSKVIRQKKLIADGKCPECGVQGHWQAMAMVCPVHGVFLG